MSLWQLDALGTFNKPYRHIGSVTYQEYVNTAKSHVHYLTRDLEIPIWDSTVRRFVNNAIVYLVERLQLWDKYRCSMLLYHNPSVSYSPHVFNSFEAETDTTHLNFQSAFNMGIRWGDLFFSRASYNQALPSLIHNVIIVSTGEMLYDGSDPMTASQNDLPVGTADMLHYPFGQLLHRVDEENITMLSYHYNPATSYHYVRQLDHSGFWEWQRGRTYLNMWMGNKFRRRKLYPVLIERMPILDDLGNQYMPSNMPTATGVSLYYSNADFPDEYSDLLMDVVWRRCLEHLNNPIPNELDARINSIINTERGVVAQ